MEILKKPHVTEKATDLAKGNQYVFDVYSRANKPEIKKAIEKSYKVDVLGVRIINIPKAGKKAIISIKKGQKIEVLPR